MKAKFYGDGYEIEVEGTIEEIIQLKRLKDKLDQENCKCQTTMYNYCGWCFCKPCMCKTNWMKWPSTTIGGTAIQ